MFGAGKGKGGMGGGGRGQGGGQGMGGRRGQGTGGRGRKGGVAAGPEGVCVCPQCGHSEPHERGVPCTQIKCPKCGTTMGRA